MRGSHRRRPDGEENINPLCNDVTDERGESSWNSLCDTGHQLNMASFGPAHALHKGIRAKGECFSYAAIQEADPRICDQLLLRARHHWPRRRASKSCDEHAALHSITSSARC